MLAVDCTTHFKFLKRRKMKTLNRFLLGLLSITFVTCSSSHKVVNSWVNKDVLKNQNYKKVFIIALTEDQAARNIVESDLSNAISEHNLEVVTSSTIFPASFTNTSVPSNDVILAKVKDLNCDLIFAVSLLNSTSETRYVPGTTSYAPYPMYGYYRGFRPYYNYYTPVVYSPGYYTTNKVYFMEANLFDVSTENILWSVQTKTYNPSKLRQFSASYSITIVNQAYDDGLLK